MKILSIDVGIKNLAFCLFEKQLDSEHFKITKWDTINISEKDSLKCCFEEKNKLLCNKPAKYKKSNKCYCLKHAKKQPFQIPLAEHKPGFINKQKIQKLFEIANKHMIPYDMKIKKIDLSSLINEYITQHYFTCIENTNASDVKLLDIGINIKTHFDKLFSQENAINYVIIENQISPIATRMKTIQGMLVQYFVMSEVVIDNIEFISASNKLKECNIKQKTTYSERKKMGIAKCLEMISSDFRFTEHLDYFNTHKKKDDLSDSFLQGIWFINEKKL